MPPEKLVDKYMNYLVSPAMLQPGADANFSIEQVTGCNVAARLAMLIHEIEVECVIPRIADGAWVAMNLNSRDVLADIVATGTTPWQTILYQQQWLCRLSGAAGVNTEKVVLVRKFDPPLLYAQKTFVWHLRSHLTTDANGAKARVGFTWVTLKDKDYMEAIENFRG